MLANMPHEQLLEMGKDFNIFGRTSPNAISKSRKRKCQTTSMKALKTPKGETNGAVRVVCRLETAEAFMVRQLADVSAGCAFVESHEWWSKTVRLMSIRSLIQFGFQFGLLQLDEDTIQAIIMAMKTAFSGGQLSILHTNYVEETDPDLAYFPRDIHATLAIIVLWFRRWHDKGLYKTPNCLPVISMNGT
jgi:hypothetical protein